MIDQGKTLIIKLIAESPVNTDTGIRDVLFELNGEMRAVQVEDKKAAIETVRREKATSDPGSIGSPSAFPRSDPQRNRRLTRTFQCLRSSSRSASRKARRSRPETRFSSFRECSARGGPLSVWLTCP